MVVFIFTVVADGRGDDFAWRERRPIVNRHDADGVHDDRLSFVDRIDRAKLFADDDGIEPIDIFQLLLPVCQTLLLTHHSFHLKQI